MASAATKEAILNVALRLFAIHGFDGVSVREIARESNANLAAISYHFKGKEGLYKAILAHCFEFVEKIIESAPKDSLAKISHYAKEMAILHQKNPYIARFVMTNILESRAFVEKNIAIYRAKVLGFLVESFENGKAEGIFRREIDTNAAVVAFVSVVNFYFFMRHFNAMPQSLQDISKNYAQNALEIFLNGMRESR